MVGVPGCSTARLAQQMGPNESTEALKSGPCVVPAACSQAPVPSVGHFDLLQTELCLGRSESQSRSRCLKDLDFADSAGGYTSQFREAGRRMQPSIEPRGALPETVGKPHETENLDANDQSARA